MPYTIYTQGQPANEQAGAGDIEAALDVAWTLARNIDGAATVVDDQSGTEVCTVSITYPQPPTTEPAPQG